MKTTAKFAMILGGIFVCGLAIGGIGFMLSENTTYQHWPTWWGNAGRYRGVASGQEEEQVFDDLRGARIEVTACDVTLEPGDQWKLKYHLPNMETIELLEVDSNQVLRMTTDYPKMNMGRDIERGYVTLTYPRGAKLDQVEIATVSGHVRVSDVEAQEVEMSSVSGSIEAVRIICAGSLDMNTISGKLHGEQLQASEMEMASTSGDLVLSAIQVDELVFSTISGKVQADGSMSDVEVDTVSGDIELTSDRALSGGINTISGDVTIGALTDTFDCNVASGDVRVNGRNESENYQGSQSPRLEVSTMSGDLDLRYTA